MCDECVSKKSVGHEFYTQAYIMEKIKNGDPVLYKNRKGTIYGKPRENKYKGLLYTVKIGEEYFKASASELTSLLDIQTSDTDEIPLQLFTQPERR